MTTRARFLDALRALVHHQVDFIVVDGVAAILGGAPVSTFDLDIVHARTSDNVIRLSAALVELDAKYRDPAGRDLRPEREPLLGALRAFGGIELRVLGLEALIRIKEALGRDKDRAALPILRLALAESKKP